MKPFMQAVPLAVALGVSILPSVAHAQVSPEFRNSKIAVWENEKGDGGAKKGDGGYWTTTYFLPDPANQGKYILKPMNPERTGVRQRMMTRRVLEEYAEFLSPLRLPHTLKLFASDCAGTKFDSPYYNPGLRAINMCYSFSTLAEGWFKNLITNHRNEKWWTPALVEQLLAGVYVAVLLHETGHAVFDLMDAPVFGRQEDAADQMAAFVALQFGKDNARTLIKGFSTFWGYWAFVAKGDPDPTRVISPGYSNSRQCSRDPADPFKDEFCSYSDTHGTASQRYYNTLCIALGGEHREWFSDILDANLLPANRLRDCNKEYKQIQLAFRKTLLPFIDPVQQQKVMQRTWFTAKELKDR